MKAEESSIPAGKHFLPGTTAESMREQPGEEDPRAAGRLLAYIMRKEGRSIRQICAALDRPYPAVRNWLVRAVQAGIGGRYDIVNPGTPGRLDAAQLARLKADLVAGPQSCGLESGTWTARLVAEHVRRRFGVEYRTQGSRYPRGRPATAPVTLSRRRFHSLGALVGGGLGCRLCDRANGDSLTGLPGSLRHRYGRIIVVLDNAACHSA